MTGRHSERHSTPTVRLGMPHLFNRGLVLMSLSLLPGATQAASITPEQALDFIESIAYPRQVGPSVFGISSGFGMSWGTAYVAASITDRRERTQDEVDASYTAGLGLLPKTWRFGADFHVGILSATPGDQDEAGNLSYKIHSRWDTEGSAIGVAYGAGNVMPWGDPEAVKTHRYGVISIAPKPSLGGAGYVWTLGYSTGLSDNGETPAGFAGFGWTLGSRASASIAWGGDEWLVGGMVKPLSAIPVFVSLGFGDVDDRLGGQRAMMTFSYLL